MTGQVTYTSGELPRVLCGAGTHVFFNGSRVCDCGQTITAPTEIQKLHEFLFAPSEPWVSTITTAGGLPDGCTWD